MASDTGYAASYYAELGWHVFPCRGKHPITKHGFKDASSDTNTVRSWWEQLPGAGIGVATGVSGFFVVDIDVKQGTDGWVGWSALCSGREMPNTMSALTPSRGTHLYFRVPDGVTIANSASKLAPGVDIRGHGGYVIVPPSDGYQWEDGPDEVGIADAPQWLIDLLCKPAQAGTEQPRLAVDGTIAAGARNDTLFKLGAYLRRTGCSKAAVLAALEAENAARCDPPLAGGEVAQIAASVMRYNVNQDIVQLVQSQPVVIVGDGDSEQAVAHTERIADPELAAALTPGGLIGDVMEFMNNYGNKRQPVLSLAATISLLGSVLGRRVRSVNGGFTNFYCVGLAPSGAGKESARKACKQILVEASMESHIGPEDFASDSGLIAAVQAQPAVLFMIDEAGRIFETMNATGARDAHTYNIGTALMRLFTSAGSVFKGKAYADADKTPVINGPCMSCYFTSVPGSFFTGITPDNLSDGFAGRLLYFMAKNTLERQTPYSGNVPFHVLSAISHLKTFGESGNIVETSSVQGHPEVILYSASGRPVFDDYRRHCDEIVVAGDVDTAGIWVRAAEHVDKLALLRATTNDKREIDAADVDWAVEIVGYSMAVITTQSADWAAANQTEKDSKYMLRMIRHAGEAGLSHREIVRGTRRLAKRVREELLDDLVVGGNCVALQIQSRGPARMVYKAVEFLSETEIERVNNADS